MIKKSLRMVVAGAVATLLLVNTGCNSNKSTEKGDTAEHAHEDASDLKIINTEEGSLSNVSEQAKSHVQNLLSHYMEIKNALVNTKSSGAKAGAEKLNKELKSFDASSLPAEQKTVYDEKVSAIKSAAESIEKSADIEGQRKVFPEITEATYSLVKSFGATDKDIYLQHCPMAFDGEGADWLSDAKEIQNPYFGEKMMKCGENKEKLAKK